MYRIRDRYKHLLNFCANLVTLGVEVALFAFIWYSYYSGEEVPLFFRRGNWAVIGIYALVVFLVTKAMNGYKIGYLQLLDMWLSNVLAIILSGFVGYVLVNIVWRDYKTPQPILWMVAVQIIFVIPWIYLIRKVYGLIYPAHRTLVIYGDRYPDELIRNMKRFDERYDVRATVSCYEDSKVIREMLPKYGAVVLADLPAKRRNKWLKYCYAHSIRTYVTPKLTDIILTAADDIHLYDTPLLISRNNGLNITERFAKRAFDILISLIFTIILSPFMLLTALCIKLYDHGPVFYYQDRLTIDGKEFHMIKFRSMRMDSEVGGAQLAKKDDDRITPVGRFIRRIHFDEIPQLFNILRGDMSFVGPRPERRVIHEQYLEDIPEFDFRLKVKSGLTGYAQVYGKYNTTPYDKLKLDLKYIQNYSFWLDIKIILLTVKVIFQKENSEGVDANQVTAKRVPKKEQLHD